MARETVAAACSSRLVATAGSTRSFSACWIARRPIASAALRTAGLIFRPRRSTGLMRKLRSDTGAPPSIDDWSPLQTAPASVRAKRTHYAATVLVTPLFHPRIRGVLALTYAEYLF